LKGKARFLAFVGETPLLVDKISDASLLATILDEEGGFFLKNNDFFATCDKADGHAFRLNRVTFSSWEKMLFHCSVAGKITSDNLISLVERPFSPVA
jgi:hypothetical protein